MVDNYHTLSLVARTLEPRLKGLEVREVFTQERDQLVMELGSPPGPLVISCDRESHTFYLDPGYTRAKRNTTALLQECAGAVITGLSILPGERILSISLGDLQLRAHLFGAGSNVFLLDAGNRIIDAFRNPRKHRGMTYDPPLSRAINNSPFEEMLRQSPHLTLGAFIKTTFPTWGSLPAKETLFRSKLASSNLCGQLSQAEFESLTEAINGIIHDLEHPQSRVYSLTNGGNGQPLEFSIIPLHMLSGVQEQLFEDVNAAIRFFVSRKKGEKSRRGQLDELRHRLESQLERAGRSLEAIGNDLSASNRAEEYERSGKILMKSLSAIKKGMDHFETSDEDGPASISLSPGLSPAENAQTYFQKAKKSRQARELARERQQSLLDQVTLLKRLLSDFPLHPSKEDLRTFMNEQKENLERLGLSKKNMEKEQLPFRIYTVDGGFEVWAGKNGESNDLLTMKHAKPNDLWFHARGASGSHVILKVNTASGEPGKKARTQAAAVAAYFSKMKNSRLVPVAMTRRKYVRKQKGAPPGTVHLEREEVIFAEPKLPGQ